MSAENNPSPVPESSAGFTSPEREALLGLARLAIEQAIRHGQALSVDPAGLPPKCHEPGSCFVTLTQSGNLRGCIGTLNADEPLWRTVAVNARGAAERDTRFPPVTPEELASLQIEISILSGLHPLPFSSPEDLLAKLRPTIDGVIVRADGHRATFLPQVWEGIPDKADFLSRLCSKAGLAPDAWRRPGIEIDVYSVEAFAEGN